MSSSTPSTISRKVVESGVESRQAAVVEAEAIIATQVEAFIGWLETRDTVPLIRSLRDAVERTRRHEMEHALKLLAKGESPEKVLEQFSQRLTNKFLHAPTQALNSAEPEERDALRLAASVSSIFTAVAGALRYAIRSAALPHLQVPNKASATSSTISPAASRGRPAARQRRDRQRHGAVLKLSREGPRSSRSSCSLPTSARPG